MKPFTIIVPVYNEEAILSKNVTTLINYVKYLKIPFEIILVSNGSTDRSEAIALAQQQKYAQVKCFFVKKKGVGRAFKQGLLKARYNHIVFIDADLSAELAFIEKANQRLEQNVMVLGAKLKGLQHRSFFRKIGSYVFYLSVLFLMRMKYIDYSPGAKAFRREFLLENINYIDDYTSFVLNLTFIATAKGEKIAEIPVECDDRRKSRFNLWVEAVSKYRGLLMLKFKQIFRML